VSGGRRVTGFLAGLIRVLGVFAGLFLAPTCSGSTCDQHKHARKANGPR
jgi:hypothetical protein